jgi:hypothetical protein
MNEASALSAATAGGSKGAGGGLQGKGSKGAKGKAMLPGRQTATMSKNGSSLALNLLPKEEGAGTNNNGDLDSYLDTNHYTYPPSRKSHRKRWTLLGILGVLVLVGVGGGLAYYFVNRSQNSDGGDGSAHQDTNGDGVISVADDNDPISQYKSGGDGSEIRMENGQTFIYRNSFGGTWNEDPSNFTAQSQSYTPSLDKEFDYASDRILGV